MKDIVRYLSEIKDEPSKMSRFKFFISLRQNIKKKCTSSLINPIQLLPCGLPPAICLDFITHKGAVWEKAGLAELGYPARAVMSQRERKALSITAWTYHLPAALPCPPCSGVPMWMTPEPFLMFGLTCRWLARACDSGDRRGCSFLNTMSETRHQETGMCSALSAASGSHWLIF